MSDPIEFYFDFSSPYAYFGAQKIEETVSGFDRSVAWKPMLLGVIFKDTGSRPLSEIPMKGAYCVNDWERLARFQDLQWTMPDPFPIPTQAAARTFYWIDDQDPDKAKAFAWDCLSTLFGEGKSIMAPETVAEIAAGQGLDKHDVLAALGDDGVKQRLKDETLAAIEKGVFGSPYFIVDGEGFWGADRLWMVKRWLRAGGW